MAFERIPERLGEVNFGYAMTGEQPGDKDYASSLVLMTEQLFRSWAESSRHRTGCSHEDPWTDFYIGY